jgi:hypothetical protein
MEGLRLSGKCFPYHARYGIRGIVDVLATELSRLYCITHQDFLEYCCLDGTALSDEVRKSLHEEYGRFLLGELATSGGEICDLKLFERGFLPRFRDYLYGDWTDLYLLPTAIPLAAVQPWSNDVPPACQIFISCVDGAYWEIYARDTLPLARIRKQFPDAEPCKLENKTA